MTIPSGYRPNKDSAVYYIESPYSGNATITKRTMVRAKDSSIGINLDDPHRIPILLGDNVWQVS